MVTCNHGLIMWMNSYVGSPYAKLHICSNCSRLVKHDKTTGKYVEDKDIIVSAQVIASFVNGVNGHKKGYGTTKQM